MIGAVGAGLQMLTNIGTAIANRQKEKRQREYNQQDYQRQLTDQKAMIADERNYNSPISALTRLREAGLNDHLAYGNAISVNNSYQRPTPLESTQTEAMPFDLSSIAEMAQKMKQNKVATAFEQQQLKSLTLDNDIKEYSLDELKKKAGLDNKESFNRSYNLQEDTMKKQEETRLIKHKARYQSIVNRIATDKDYGLRAFTEMNMLSDKLEYAINREKKNLIPLEKEKLEETIKTIKKNNRILEQQALLWEKGIKPNATLIEQLMDEFIYSMVNTDDAGLKVLESIATEVPIVGAILQTIIDNRRKQSQEALEAKDKE